jgi:transcriptional regulator with XRE-family HTH domain
VPHLERLAAGLRTARLAAGLTQSRLAVQAGLNPTTIYRIEAAVRRTRASTLRRVAEALVKAEPRLGDPARVTADLATLAGSGLAPESNYRERIERRRVRRERRLERFWADYRPIAPDEEKILAVGREFSHQAARRVYPESLTSTPRNSSL